MDNRNLAIKLINLLKLLKIWLIQEKHLMKLWINNKYLSMKKTNTYKILLQKLLMN